jgi:hypothetical protein
LLLFRLSPHPCHLIFLFLKLYVLHLQFSSFSRGKNYPKA